MATIADARRVKEQARALTESVAKVTGVGVTKVKGQYAVKVNVRTRSAKMDSLPKKIDGVTVVYAVTGPIKPRG